MQFLPPLTSDQRVIDREAPVGRHLPYVAQIDDHTLLLRDGVLMQAIELGGFLFETADAAELNYRKALRDASLQALSSPRYALYHHVVRARVDVAHDAAFPDRFSAELDARWRQRIDGRALLTNRIFLTILMRPLKGQRGFLDRALSWFGREGTNEPSWIAERQSLSSARDALIASLDAYGPRLLGIYESPQGPCSELLQYLGLLLNGIDQPTLLPHMRVADYLATRRISFGQNAVELGASGPSPRSFCAMVSIKDYAAQTAPGMLDALMRLPVEFSMTQSFAFVERRKALDAMNLALRRMRSAEDEALTLRSELSVAKDVVAGGRASFGEHHLSLRVDGASLAELDEAVARVTAKLGDLGVVAVREDIALEPTYWAQFPGNFPYIGRKGLISTANFAGFASLHNFALGQQHGTHWGEAVSLLETTAAGPYFFNFHVGDLGNFTVIGPSGSGKTVVLNFLLAQARRFNPRIIFFDKDRGAELFLRAIGGSYDRIRPGEPTGINPLHLTPTAVNRQFLNDWIAMLAGGVTSEEAQHIAEAVATTLDQPMAMRRLCYLVELFRGRDRPTATDLYARLRPWWGEGARAWLFDNERDRTDVEARTVGFDMTAVLDDPVTRSPTMMYLFHRIEERLDGTPAIIVVDEGWKALDDDVFVRRIKDWEKTIRKRNGIVGFATQSARDALESQISSAIIEQAATQIFMMNPKAAHADYVTGFGLSEHEFSLIRTLPDSARCFLVKQGNQSAVVRLDLADDPELLTILSGRESTVRLFDSIAQQVGTDPRAWMGPLLEAAA